MRKLIYVFGYIFMLAPAYGSDPNTFGSFKDLHSPFLNSEYPELSPIQGLERRVTESIRMNAFQGREDKGFERPDSRSIDPLCFPQTAFAAFLERLFTSHVGLLANSCARDPIHDWLKPKNIALIFNAITSEGFYDLESTAAALLLAEAFNPETYRQVKRRAEKRKTKPELFNQFLMKQAELKAPLKFAELMLLSLKETSDQKAIEAGLPKAIVPQVLLVFMWEKKSAKSDLIPFYQVLSNRIIDKDALNKIIWQGEGSFYTEKDYWAAKKIRGKLPLELSRLLRLGYAHFEDRLPPEIYYGMSFVKMGKETLPFSDCGETSLRHLFTAFIYDPEQRIFDWKRLKALRKKGIMVLKEVVNFFRYTCTRPVVVDTPFVPNKWAEICSQLNLVDDPNPIHMLHPIENNGKFGIGAGIQNIFNAMGHILCDPEWNKAGMMPCQRINHQLNRLCTIFSPSRLLPNCEARWEWEYSSLNHLDIGPRTELQPNLRLRDQFNTTIILKLNGYHVYEWHILPNHFEFNRANPSYYSAEDELESMSFTIPHNMTEDAFPRFLYNNDLRSLRGRLIAINRIYWFKQTFKKTTYDALLDKWFDPSGRYLGYFGDYASNQILLTILIRHGKSIDDIFDMQIPKLTANLIWMQVRSRNVQSVAHLFRRDIQLFHQEGSPHHQYHYGRAARICSIAMLKADKDDLELMLKAGLDEYIQTVASKTPLSLAFITGEEKVLQGFSKLAVEGTFSLVDKENPTEFVRQIFGSLDSQSALDPMFFFLNHVRGKINEADFLEYSDLNLCKIQ